MPTSPACLSNRHCRVWYAHHRRRYPASRYRFRLFHQPRSCERFGECRDRMDDIILAKPGKYAKSGNRNCKKHGDLSRSNIRDKLSGGGLSAPSPIESTLGGFLALQRPIATKTEASFHHIDPVEVPGAQLLKCASLTQVKVSTLASQTIARKPRSSGMAEVLVWCRAHG